MWEVFAEKMAERIPDEVAIPENRVPGGKEIQGAVDDVLDAMALTSEKLVDLEMLVRGYRRMYEALVRSMLEYGVNPDRVMGDTFSVEEALESRIWDDLDMELGEG